MALKETERVPVELIILTLLLDGDLSKPAIYNKIAEDSDYRVNVSRAMLSTALRKLEEKGYVQRYQTETNTPAKLKRYFYHLLDAGHIAQDIAYEEYYSTLQGMRLLLDFGRFEDRIKEE